MSFVSTKEEIAEIKELLETKDHCKVIPQKSFNTIWFRGDNGETENEVHAIRQRR